MSGLVSIQLFPCFDIYQRQFRASGLNKASGLTGLGTTRYFSLLENCGNEFMMKLLFSWRKINNITTNWHSFQHFTIIKITSQIGIQNHLNRRLPAGGMVTDEVEVFMAIGLRHLPFWLCLLKAKRSSNSWKKMLAYTRRRVSGELVFSVSILHKLNPFIICKSW